MMYRLLCMSAAVMLGLALLSGCSGGKAEQEAKGFVQNYCSLLQDAYSRVDLQQIAPMTTEKELKKLVPLFQAMSVTGNSMKTEILEFKIGKVKVEDKTATVKTSEKWRFWWVAKESGAITKPKKEESYDLEYHLVKVDGSWRVDSIKNLNDPGH
jgi:hypothetical protein